MARRQQEHEEGKTRTTNRCNQSYSLGEIRYEEVPYTGQYPKEYEKTVKHLSIAEKLLLSNNWRRWAG